MRLGIAEEFIIRFQARVDTKGQGLSQASGSKSEGKIQIKLRLKPGVQEQGAGMVMAMAATADPKWLQLLLGDRREI